MMSFQMFLLLHFFAITTACSEYCFCDETVIECHLQEETVISIEEHFYTIKIVGRVGPRMRQILQKSSAAIILYSDHCGDLPSCVSLFDEDSLPETTTSSRILPPIFPRDRNDDEDQIPPEDRPGPDDDDENGHDFDHEDEIPDDQPDPDDDDDNGRDFDDHDEIPDDRPRPNPDDDFDGGPDFDHHEPDLRPDRPDFDNPDLQPDRADPPRPHSDIENTPTPFNSDNENPDRPPPFNPDFIEPDNENHDRPPPFNPDFFEPDNENPDRPPPFNPDFFEPDTPPPFNPDFFDPDFQPDLERDMSTTDPEDDTVTTESPIHQPKPTKSPRLTTFRPKTSETKNKNKKKKGTLQDALAPIGNEWTDIGIPAVIATSTLIVFCIFLRCMCKYLKWCCGRRVNKRNRMRGPQNVGSITDPYERTTPTSDAVRRRSPERNTAPVVLEMANVPLENTPPPPKKRSWFCFRKKAKNSPTPSEVEVVSVGADSQSSEEF